MTHPGMAFVFVVGVGLATILYYMFADSNNSHGHNGPHGSGNSSNGRPPSDSQNSWCQNTTPSTRAKNRRKDSSCSIDKASCTICLMEITVQHIVSNLPCGHPFHKTCIQNWQKQVEMPGHKNCPVCRRRIDLR